MATCVLSARSCAPSTGIDPALSVSSPTRRGLLAFAASAGLAAVPAVVADAASPISSWDLAHSRYLRASETAEVYEEDVYKPAFRKWKSLVGDAPPLYFDWTATNGEVARYPVKLESSGDFFLPVFEQEAERVRKNYQDWLDNMRVVDRDPKWVAISEKMEALDNAVDEAREAVFVEPAPHAAALAFKVQLAFADEEMTGSERDAISADASRMAA